MYLALPRSFSGVRDPSPRSGHLPIPLLLSVSWWNGSCPQSDYTASPGKHRPPSSPRQTSATYFSSITTKSPTGNGTSHLSPISLQIADVTKNYFVSLPSCELKTKLRLNKVHRRLWLVRYEDIPIFEYGETDVSPDTVRVTRSNLKLTAFSPRGRLVIFLRGWLKFLLD